MKGVLFGLCLFGCVSADLLQSLTVEGVSGRDAEWNASLVLKPWQGSQQIGEGTTVIGYHLEPWFRWNSEDKFRGVSRPRMEQAPAVDFREVFAEWRGDALSLKLGRFLPEPGLNRLINPASIASLNFHDPIHPDRMGLWGGRLDVGSGLWVMAYQTQASLGSYRGVRRVIPDTFEAGELRYGRDTGLALGLAGGEGLLRWQWIQNLGISDIPVLAPRGPESRRVDFFYEKSFSSALALEYSHDLFGLRHELRYERPDESPDNWWGVFELDRSHYFHSLDRTLNLNVFWAYSTGRNDLPAYERLRRDAAGLQFSFDLSSDARWQWLQEFVVGTRESDAYAKSNLQYSMTSSQWLTLSYEHRELRGFEGDQEGLWSVVFRKWFW